MAIFHGYGTMLVYQREIIFTEFFFAIRIRWLAQNMDYGDHGFHRLAAWENLGCSAEMLWVIWRFGSFHQRWLLVFWFDPDSSWEHSWERWVCMYICIYVYLVVPSFGIKPEKHGINPGNQRYNRHLLYSFAWIYVIYVHAGCCRCQFPGIIGNFERDEPPKTRHTKKNHSWSFKLNDYECQYGVSIESISSSSKNEWVSFPANLW